MSDDVGIFDSVKDALKKRMTSLWAGTFVIAWATWNYRFLLVMLSDGDYAKKLDFIDEGLAHPPGGWEGIGPPLFFSFSYVLLAPLLSLAVEAWHGMVQKLRIRLQLWQEGSKPMARDEVLVLLHEREEREQELKTEVKLLSDQLTASYAATEQARAAARGHLIARAGFYFTAGALEPISIRLPRLSQREGLSDRVKHVLEHVNGLPWPSYLMLRALSNTPSRSADQLARDADVPVSSTEPEALLFLVGGGLVGVEWGGSAQPLFRISASGKRLMELCSQSYEDALVRPVEEQWAAYAPEPSDVVPF